MYQNNGLLLLFSNGKLKKSMQIKNFQIFINKICEFVDILFTLKNVDILIQIWIPSMYLLGYYLDYSDRWQG